MATSVNAQLVKLAVSIVSVAALAGVAGRLSTTQPAEAAQPETATASSEAAPKMAPEASSTGTESAASGWRSRRDHERGEHDDDDDDDYEEDEDEEDEDEEDEDEEDEDEDGWRGLLFGSPSGATTGSQSVVPEQKKSRTRHS